MALKDVLVMDRVEHRVEDNRSTLIKDSLNLGPERH